MDLKKSVDAAAVKALWQTISSYKFRLELEHSGITGFEVRLWLDKPCYLHYVLPDGTEVTIKSPKACEKFLEAIDHLCESLS